MRTAPGREPGAGRPPPTLAAVLRIDQATYDAIVAHAKRDHPDEACGVVAGPEGSDRPERFVADGQRRRAPDVLRVRLRRTCSRLYQEMDDRDEEPVVIYHSHTATEAYPSPHRHRAGEEPNAHYVLVSTREHGNSEGPVEFRSYRIVDGEVTEEEVAVVAATSHEQPRSQD